MIEMAIEKKFWNKKYEEGGNSGRGSIGLYRNWKWNRIHEMIPKIREVLDVGCGDLSFWKHPIANKILKKEGFDYLGIDISDEIINRNKKFAPKMKFVCDGSHVNQGIEMQVVFCLDLLFHIMNDVNFELTLQHLCESAKEWIVVYSWQTNPFPYSATDGKSQTFRRLTDYQYIFDHLGFKLQKLFRVPFDRFGVLYFFKRVIY